MNISLEPDVQRFVEGKVKTGQFASVDDAINTLLLDVCRQENLSVADIDALRREVDIGLAEADRGEFADYTAEKIIAERHAALAAQRKVS